VDTSKVSLGEMIAGISALALFIFMFLPWYELESVAGFDVGGADANAWESFSFIDVLLLLVVIIVVGLVLARAADAMPDLPQPAGLIIEVAGGLALLLILFRLIFTPDVDAAVDVDLGRQIGIFLGLVAAGGIAYGGWRTMNEVASPRLGGNRGAAATGGTQTTSASSTPPSPPPVDSPAAPPPAGGTTPAPASPPAEDRSPAGGTTPPAEGQPPGGEPPRQY